MVGNFETMAKQVTKVHKRDRSKRRWERAVRICAGLLTVLAILIAVFVYKGLPVLELVIAYWAVSAVESACTVFARRA